MLRLLPMSITVETQDEGEKVNIASTESPTNVETHSPYQEHNVTTSLSADQVFSSQVLPTPVPCTRGPVSTRARTTSLPDNAGQAAAVALRYPHVDLPSNTPPYLFSETIFTPNHKLLGQLMEMGITEMAANKALYWTGNSCIELASNWVFERSEESLKTPLKVEIQMLTADLEMKEAEMRDRILSVDSGVHMLDDDEDMLDDDEDEMEYHAWEMEQMMDMSAEYELYKFVLVVNKSHQFKPGQMTELVAMATGHMLARVAMLEFGEEQLDMWEACGEQLVVLEGENTRHLMDLRLAAECLGLERVEVGRDWDNVNRRYREVVVLGILGEENVLHKVVGRLEEAA